jgi:ornithine decarboxylase
MSVRGVSFHVGSGGCSFDNYKRALQDSETLFNLAEAKGMPSMDILDIGGGFSTESNYSQNQQFTFELIAP